MAVEFSFFREDLTRYLADTGPLAGPDPMLGEAPPEVSSVLWNLSSPGERQALLAAVPMAEATAVTPTASAALPSAGAIDTSQILDPYYRALSDANGGFWKHDPSSDVQVGNHWMTVGTDVDGGTIYRMLTDFDMYGPGANNAYDPMAGVSWVQETNVWAAQVSRYNAQQSAIDRAERAQAAGIAAWAEAGVAGWLAGSGAVTGGAPAAGSLAGTAGFNPATADEIVVTASQTGGNEAAFRPLPMPMLPTERLQPEVPVPQPALAAGTTPAGQVEGQTFAICTGCGAPAIADWGRQPEGSAHRTAWEAVAARLGTRYPLAIETEIGRQLYGPGYAPAIGAGPAAVNPITSFLDGAIRGDYSTDDSLARTAGQVAVGFVPVAGQIADLRDISAAIGDIGRGEAGGWGNLGLAAIGLVPGIGDAAKAASRGGDVAAAALGGAARAAEPGEWRTVNEYMSDRARAYQAQITGRSGEAYFVGGVKFDGYRDGVLLEAKGPGYDAFIREGKFVRWFEGGISLSDQVASQLRAADGRPIHWHVAEPGMFEMIRSMTRGEPNVNVILTPIAN